MKLKSLLKEIFATKPTPIQNIITVNPATKFIKGRALVSYLKDSALWEEGDLRFQGHSNNWESREIVHVFLKLGYIVDVIDCLYNGPLPETNYDVIFDIYINLQRMAPFNSRAVKLLHLTGAYFKYSNAAELKRVSDLETRKNGLYTPKRLVANTELNERSLKLSHKISLIGNTHTLHTYPDEYHHKISLVSVSGSQLNFLKSVRDYISDKKEFLWLFGGGVVHKGLDLLLEVFSKNRNLVLNIVGDIRNEKDFIQLYQHELTKLPNIKAHGYLNLSDRKFIEITNTSFCFIAPSCSEGMSPAVATCLQIGLYPIISRDTGVTLPEDAGTYLESCSIEEIESAIFGLLKMKDRDIISQIERCQAMALKTFNRDQFTSNITRFIKGSLLDSGE